MAYGECGIYIKNKICEKVYFELLINYVSVYSNDKRTSGRIKPDH